MSVCTRQHDGWNQKACLRVTYISVLVGEDAPQESPPPSGASSRPPIIPDPGEVALSPQPFPHLWPGRDLQAQLQELQPCTSQAGCALLCQLRLVKNKRRLLALSQCEIPCKHPFVLTTLGTFAPFPASCPPVRLIPPR